jgi:hypothetical protein
MATLGLRHSWLLALADPASLAAAAPDPLPERAMWPADLAAVCDLAQRHGVLPAVLANLKRALAVRGRAAVFRGLPTPAEAETLASAEEALVQRTGLTMLLRHQAAEITAALAGDSAPVAVIKGPEFADRLYPSPALRLFSDIDLLIRQDDVAAAETVMQRLGYEPADAAMKYDAGYGERGWRRAKGPGGLVEIHWNLVNSPTLRRMVSVTLSDLQMEVPQITACEQAVARDRPRLTPASLLLIAAVHGATSHGFDRLQMLYDVAQVVREAAGPVDEAWLSAATVRTGSVLALETALRLAGDLVPEPRCTAMLERLSLPPASWLSRAALSPGTVLRAHAAVDGLRRQAFREFLKRR